MFDDSAGAVNVIIVMMIKIHVASIMLSVYQIFGRKFSSWQLQLSNKKLPFVIKPQLED